MMVSIDQSATALLKLARLKRLALITTKVTDAEFTTIAKIESLPAPNLQSTKVSDEAAAILTELSDRGQLP